MMDLKKIVQTMMGEILLAGLTVVYGFALFLQLPDCGALLCIIAMGLGAILAR